MRTERHLPDDPREWLNRARSSLLHAGASQDGVYPEELCFDAQQAAEKAIKAVMLGRKVSPPYTHDLANLLSILEDAGERIPEQVRRAAELTRFAVFTRYPGVGRPVSQEEYAESLATAEAVVRWAEEKLRLSP